MSDFKVSTYSTVSAFFSASATVLNTFAKSEGSIASRFLAAGIIEAARLTTAASVETCVASALKRLKAEVLEPASLKVYRSNVTTAISFLRRHNAIPKVEGGMSEPALLATVQTVIDTYTLRGIVKAAKEERDAKAAPKAKAKEASKVAETQRVHDANREARKAMGVNADCELDVLALTTIVNAFVTAADAGDDQAQMVLDMLHASLEARRADKAIPLAIAA